MKTIKPTPLKIAVVAGAVIWLLLLIVSSPGRVCFSDQCFAQAWKFVGDFVWLRGLAEWQTLMALIAALLGAFYVNKQIKQAEAQENERRRRVMASARSMMPHTLAALVDYLQKCASNLMELQRLSRGELIPCETPYHNFPPVPMDVISPLQKMIEASDETTAMPFSLIISKLQVLDSRLRSYEASNIENYVMTVVDIHASALALFPFARGESDDLPSAGMITGQYMTSLCIMGFQDYEFPEFFSAAAERIVDIVGTGGNSRAAA